MLSALSTHIAQAHGPSGIETIYVLYVMDETGWNDHRCIQAKMMLVEKLQISVTPAQITHTEAQIESPMEYALLLLKNKAEMIRSQHLRNEADVYFMH